MPVKVPAPVTGEPETVKIDGNERPTLVTVPPLPVADKVPVAKEIPLPIVTFENPPEPLP